MPDLLKILIVDDDPYISEMYTTKFKSEPLFQLELAGNGKEALEKAASFQPQVMLLDVIMPIFDGFEVLKKLKESGALGTMKVIILSNLGQKEDIERGLQLGATDYIIKAHFTPSEVMEKVKQVVSK